MRMNLSTWTFRSMAGTTTQESFLERANISGLDHRIRSRTGPNNIFVATTNSHSNVPVHQQNYFPTDMILDPQLMGLDMGIIDANFNFMLPVTTEQQANSSELAHSIENSQYLGIPMDSSQDESSVTPDVMCSSQSNSTPETVPDVDDTEEGAQEEESLFVTDQDEITVHYGMVSIVQIRVFVRPHVNEYYLAPQRRSKTGSGRHVILRRSTKDRRLTVPILQTYGIPKASDALFSRG